MTTYSDTYKKNTVNNKKESNLLFWIYQTKGTSGYSGKSFGSNLQTFFNFIRCLDGHGRPTVNNLEPIKKETSTYSFANKCFRALKDSFWTCEPCFKRRGSDWEFSRVANPFMTFISRNLYLWKQSAQVDIFNCGSNLFMAKLGSFEPCFTHRGSNWGLSRVANPFMTFFLRIFHLWKQSAQVEIFNCGPTFHG